MVWLLDYTEKLLLILLGVEWPSAYVNKTPYISKLHTEAYRYEMTWYLRLPLKYFITKEEIGYIIKEWQNLHIYQTWMMGAMDWIMFLSNSHVEPLIPNKTVFGDRAFRRWLRLNEVVKVRS